MVYVGVGGREVGRHLPHGETGVWWRSNQVGHLGWVAVEMEVGGMKTGNQAEVHGEARGLG